MARTARSRPAIALAAGMFAVLPSLTARSAAIPDARRPVGYAVVEQDIDALLAGLATEAGLRADVSRKVTGVVRGRLPPGGLTDTLDRLGGIYGFQWYSDGVTLHVSAAGEARMQMLPLGDVDATAFLQTLDAFGISDPRWPVRFSEARDIALVDGPPSFVALVAETLEALGRRAKERSVSVTVFRG